MTKTVLRRRSSILSSVIILVIICDVISDVTARVETGEYSRWKRSAHSSEQSAKFHYPPSRTTSRSAKTSLHGNGVDNPEQFSASGHGIRVSDEYLNKNKGNNGLNIDKIKIKETGDLSVRPANLEYSKEFVKSSISEPFRHGNEAKDGKTEHKIERNEMIPSRNSRGGKDFTNSIRDADGMMVFRIGDKTLHFPSLDLERNVKYRFKFGKKSVGENCDPALVSSVGCTRKISDPIESEDKIGPQMKSGSEGIDGSPKLSNRTKIISSSKSDPSKKTSETLRRDIRDLELDSKILAASKGYQNLPEGSSKVEDNSGRRVKRLSKLDLLEKADGLLSDLAAAGKNKAKFKFGKRARPSERHSGSQFLPQSCENCGTFGGQGDGEGSQVFIPPNTIFLPGREGYFPVVVRRTAPGGVPKDFGLFGAPVSTGSNRLEEENRFQPVRSVGLLRQSHRNPDIGYRFRFGKR